MFAKFTERARKVMSLARQEAQRLENNYICTEHVLLGILQEGGSVASKVLQNLNVDSKTIRKEIEKLIGPGDAGEISLGQLPFSPRVKRAIELAGEAALQLGHDVIGTEHMLLGLLQENEGIAAQVLTSLGLKVDEVRDMALEVLAQDLHRQPPLRRDPPAQAERNLYESAQAYLALTDRPTLQDSIVQHLQQGRSLALVGPAYVGKTSLLFALSRAKAGGFAYCSIDFRIFDEFHVEQLPRPKREGTVCFVPEGELVTASRSLVADLLDERRRGGQRLILEFREGGMEAYAARYPDLAKDLVPVDVTPPDAAECARLLESARPQLKERMRLGLSDETLQEADRLARARWPRMVAPWATLITLWKAASIQNETQARGDIQRLEWDIENLERAEDASKRLEAELLRRHVEGLRGVGKELSQESVRQAIGELADKLTTPRRSHL